MLNNSKTASIIKRRYSKMQELCRPVFEQIEINRNLYKSVIEVDDTYEWDYSLTDPHVFPIIRNYLSRANPSHTRIRLDARKSEDYEKRQVNQDLVNWELGEIMLTSLFYRMYYSGFIGGIGYAKTGWKYEPAIKIKTPQGDMRVMREILNRADAKFVRMNDILVPNRNIPTIYEQPYYIELVQKRMGDILDENENEEYWDKAWIDKLRKGGVELHLLDYQMDMVKDDDTKDEFAFRSAVVSLICMHTLENDVLYIPLKGDDKVVNKVQENKHWHGHYDIIEFKPFPEDDEYYSMSVVDAVADLQIAATEILNQNLTNIRQINNEMFIAGSDAAQTPDWQFYRRPSGVIRVAGDVSQIQQMNTKDNTMSSLRMSQDVQNKIERASGISSLYSSGAPGQAINQTARGAQIIEQNIDANMRMIIDLFGEQVVKTMGEHFLELNAQYITEEQSFSVTGKRNVKDLVTIDPSRVSANFDVSVNAERMIKQTPASRQQSLQNTITTLSGIANQTGILMDLVPVVEALVDATPDLENVDDVVVTIDEKAKRDIAMLERGQEVEVKVRDPHMELLQVMKIHYEDNQAMYTPDIQAVFGKYYVDHIRFMQSQQEINMMSQPQLPAPMSADGLVAGMGNGEQAGLPENERGYDLGSLIPERSGI
jgi:hypothetical protein